jgi:hypothetical protein
MEYICLNPKYFRGSFTSNLCKILSPTLWIQFQDSKIEGDTLESKGHVTYCNLKNILELDNGDVSNYIHDTETE